jgi:hypothetical protein
MTTVDPPAREVGTIARISVSLQVTIEPLLLPNLTELPVCVVPNDDPVTVIVSPPLPESGETDRRTGAGELSTGITGSPASSHDERYRIDIAQQKKMNVLVIE